MKIDHLNIRNAVCLITLLSLVITMTSCSDSKTYKYPGNGFPHLSKNQPVKALEDDIWLYGKSFTNVRKENDYLVFQDINNFKFKSPKAIEKDRFVLKVQVTAEKGECRLELGSLRFEIGEDKLLIENKRTILYDEKNVKLETITISRASNGKECVVITGRDGLFKIFNPLEIEGPTIITLELEKDFSGQIGPWVWVRGRK